jgi:DnaJ-domain-containing protein 1
MEFIHIYFAIGMLFMASFVKNMPFFLDLIVRYIILILVYIFLFSILGFRKEFIFVAIAVFAWLLQGVLKQVRTKSNELLLNNPKVFLYSLAVSAVAAFIGVFSLEYVWLALFGHWGVMFCYSKILKKLPFLELIVGFVLFYFCWYHVVSTDVNEDTLGLLVGLFMLPAMIFCWYAMISNDVEKRKKKAEILKFKEGFLAVAGMAAVLMRYNGGYTEKARALFCGFVKENFSGAELYKKEYLEEAEKRIEQLIGKHKLNFKKICVEVNRNLSYEKKVEMMRLLYDIAILDGGIYPEERKLLSQIMAHIRISAEQAQIFENTYSRYYYDSRASQERAKGAYTSSGTYIPSRLVEAYAVLGLKPGTALDEVKRVYRRLVFENHPDRLAHADEATRAAAEERTRELNRAMSLIEKYS